MLVVLLITVPVASVTVWVLVVKGLISFRRHAQTRFRYTFFRIWHFLAILFGTSFVFLGNWVRSAFDPASHGFDGIALMVLGAGFLSSLFLQNCRKTNLPYGLAGTALELAVSPVLFIFIIVCLPALVLGASGFLSAKRVYVINQGW